MRPIRIISLVAALAAGVAPLSPLPAVAERAQPVEGRESLFQRVLTRRGAVLLETPDGAEIESPPPFTAYYVYGEEGNYTRVGNRIEDGALGYVSTEELVPWNTAIVATFNNRAAQDRGRELLFDSEDALKAVLQDEDVSSAIAFLRERAAAGNAPEGSGVLSIEPEEFVDVEENLYIMPILEDKAYRLPGRHRGKALRVASMSATPPVEGLTDEERAALLKDFKVEIAFVIDTTKSMQPYIQETRTAIRDFATRLEESDITGKFSFAIVAFRDSTELRPELEYVTRKVLDFSDASGVEAFLASLDEVQATSVSSQGFSEDSLAGLHTAINDLDWDDAAAKMIFLVTDASPREENRSGEATDLLEAEMQVLAEDQQKAIFTWHLQRPGTEFDHAAGEAAYGELSRFGDVDTYTPIPLGDPS
ncbi:MAG: vWA domain-containing protein, partial [Pseudomonadota bacterium]